MKKTSFKWWMPLFLLHSWNVYFRSSWFIFSFCDLLAYQTVTSCTCPHVLKWLVHQPKFLLYPAHQLQLTDLSVFTGRWEIKQCDIQTLKSWWSVHVQKWVTVSFGYSSLSEPNTMLLPPSIQKQFPLRTLTARYHAVLSVTFAHSDPCHGWSKLNGFVSPAGPEITSSPPASPSIAKVSATSDSLLYSVDVVSSWWW